MTTTFRARARGPLLVISEGPCEVFRADGTQVSIPADAEGRTRLLFCRCGKTGAAPMCDGAHNRCDFEKTE